MVYIITSKGMKADHYGNYKSSPQGKQTARKKDTVQGVWENIGPEPIYIQDKKHLKQECEKRGVIPKMFMKPKSQGKGHTWTY